MDTALVATASTPIDLGPMPLHRRMRTVDERIVHAPVAVIFELAAQVERWPTLLPHYRFVRFRKRTSDGGGIVEMAANRPFGPLSWPTWWCSEMRIDRDTPSIRFRHIGGVTTGMDVQWQFSDTPAGTRAHILHLWDGPTWPLIGGLAATIVIGPIFVHGIASRTLAGLARVAETGGVTQY
jgi:ribosome-associated toxin RatA of RatAB toxin-antitoxin module